MEKIKMQNAIAELDGDEMTRVLWGMIKDELILPFVDLNTEYYDLSIQNRDKTEDTVTVQAAEAIKRLHVGVKCATITPNLQRQEEYHLKKLWKSPNATIRAALDGTVSCWKKPITIARHAYGDIYKAVEYRVPGAGKAELVFTDESGAELSRQTVYDFKGPGVLQAMHNRDDSILSFARCCFTYALSVHQDVWFSSKDTISKDYDQTFKLLFQKGYDEEFQDQFEAAGLHYRYALIDDVAAKVIRSEGGMIWACKNYDGDVMSDLIAAASGSLPMMTSVLVSPDGNFEYEAAHGTVPDKLQGLGRRGDEDADARTTERRPEMGKPRVDAHDALGTGQRGGRRRQSGPRSHFGAGNGPDQTLHALALDVAAPEENASEACAGELAAQMRPVLLGPELFVTARIDG